MPDAPDATAEKKVDKTGTEYVVLRQEALSEDGGAAQYTSVETVSAANDIAAINAALGENPTAGTYLAIPARSFRVRVVSVATVTQTKVA